MGLNENILRMMPPTTTFVETGTRRGNGIQCALEAGFDDVRSVDIDVDAFTKAALKYSHDYRVRLYLGDSGLLLPAMLHGVPYNAVLWLDSHEISTQLHEHNCPILRELDVLRKYPIRAFTILVDDIDVFEDAESTISVEQITEYINAINPDYNVTTITGNGDDNRILVAGLNMEQMRNVL